MLLQHSSFILTALLARLGSVTALDNGLARTPHMGYNTWNCFGGDINEDIIKSTADIMIQTGLDKAGYEYLVIDDGWSELDRGKDDKIIASKDRFPSGMLNVSHYVHSRGLKFGMYSDAGSKTCLGLPGSRGKEELDAQYFADLGVDFLKYDNCHAPASDWIVDRYSAMRDALNKTGRPILFSMCNWGAGDPWKWAQKVGNSWRTTQDIEDSWDGMLRCLDNTIGLSRYAQPGAWNDPDMLEVGNAGLLENEQRSHFALWSLLKSPLFIGADMRKLSKSALKILTAGEVIAVNQDPLGVAGDLIWKEGPMEVYAGPLKGGSRAVVLFNRHSITTQYPISNVTVTWEQLGYPSDVKADVRDLHAERTLGTFQYSFTAGVDIHDAVMVKISPQHMKQEYEEWRPWPQRQRLLRKSGIHPTKYLQEREIMSEE
ncbi:hypothetical protein ABBQ32_002472 [Trebouxia sp. C0010 RCD-2024]